MEAIDPRLLGWDLSPIEQWGSLRGMFESGEGQACIPSVQSASLESCLLIFSVGLEERKFGEILVYCFAPRRTPSIVV